MQGKEWGLHRVIVTLVSLLPSTAAVMTPTDVTSTHH